MQHKKQFYSPILISLILISGIFIGYILNQNGSNSFAFSPLDKQNKINEVLKLIQNDYVDTINEQELIETSLNGILHNLDPHSIYIPAKNFNKIEDEMLGNFDGIGVQYRIIDDSIVVIMPISGGPSAKKGIRAGDRIIGVDRDDITKEKITNAKVMKLLKGPKGSTVLLTI